MFKKISVLALVLLLTSCAGTKYTSNNKSKSSTNKTVVKKPTTSNNTRSTTNNSTKKSETVTLEATSNRTVSSDVVVNYINDFKETAKENMRVHGIPASITLAQGILESGSGKGRLAQEANNHFGIKCHTGWTGDSIHHDDDAAQECFRKYKFASESYRDHSLFLTSRSRYASLFKLNKGDYQGWAHGLRAAGYATDVKYPEKLISLIERYQLYQYDNEVLGKETIVVKEVSKSSNTHLVSKGDTLYSISRLYGISVDELKKLNTLTDNAISIGQILKIK